MRSFTLQQAIRALTDRITQGKIDLTRAHPGYAHGRRMARIASRRVRISQEALDFLVNITANGPREFAAFLVNRLTSEDNTEQERHEWAAVMVACREYLAEVTI